MGKKFSSSPVKESGDNPTRHQLIELLWMTIPAYNRWAESQMSRFDGLTPQRMRLMGLLWKNGRMKMSSLGDELGVTPTNITALVDALEKDKKVKRLPHPTDRRSTMIELTDKGEQWIDENCGALKDKISELFSGFSKAQQQDFVAHLLHMRKALVDHNMLEVSDICSAAS